MSGYGTTPPLIKARRLYELAGLRYAEVSLREEKENEDAKKLDPKATRWFAERIGAWNNFLEARRTYLAEGGKV